MQQVHIFYFTIILKCKDSLRSNSPASVQEYSQPLIIFVRSALPGTVSDRVDDGLK